MRICDFCAAHQVTGCAPRSTLAPAGLDFGTDLLGRGFARNEVASAGLSESGHRLGSDRDSQPQSGCLDALPCGRSGIRNRHERRVNAMVQVFKPIRTLEHDARFRHDRLHDVRIPALLVGCALMEELAVGARAPPVLIVEGRNGGLGYETRPESRERRNCVISPST
jgi:hypothetical protein